MDLADYFRQELQKMHKLKGGNFGNSLDPVAVTQRIAKLNNKRKETRNDSVLRRRKISDTPLTPIGEKSATKSPKKANNAKKVIDERRILLEKWKANKELLRANAKKNSKPIFKVCHSSGFLTTGDALNQIKGKPILNEVKNSYFKLAPSSTYKFKPPSNIQPISLKKFPLKSGQALESKNLPTRRVTRSQKSQLSPHVQLPAARKRLQYVKEAKTLKEKSPTKKQSRAQKKSPVEEVKKLKSTPVNDEKLKKSKRLVKKAENLEVTPPTVHFQQSESSKKRTGSRKKIVFQRKKTPMRRKSKNKDSTDNSSTSSSTSSTPANIKKDENPITYISPFVTISRGKCNARKEFQDRSFSGGTYSTPDKNPSYSKSTSPERACLYFRKVLDGEIERLQALCNKWIEYKEENNPPEEVCNMIDVVLGQTQLLITSKFEQFRGLINTCQSGRGENPVTCLDLHGFWDMVFIQVENLNKRFENLDNLRDRNWEEILPEAKPIIRKNTRVKKMTTKSSSSLRDAIRAQKKKMKSNDDLVTICAKTPPRNRRSRKSSNRNSTSDETGLIMIKASQSTKYLTPPVPGPCKSILKSGKSKSVNRQVKAVLFKEAEYINDENSPNKINSPQVQVTTPLRRSLRLNLFN